VHSVVTAWAPGRVNLIGEHTDYSGGLVMPAAIHLGIAVEGCSQDGVVTLRSTAFGEGESFKADGGGSPIGGWARLGQAVAAELHQLGRPPVGLTATITSNLPSGVGLSSSAALEVGIALALCEVGSFRLDPLALASACQRAESDAVGVPCGILDQAACLLGEEDTAILLDCASLEHRLVPIPRAVSFLVLDSGVERTLETTGYATRRAELERGLSLLGVEGARMLSVGDLGRLDSLSRRRVRHVITENERVLQFAAALTEGDLVAAGHLMSESHSSLRDDYEVSTPELDMLAAIAEGNGAYGARLVGGGFGGAVLALVDSESSLETGRAIMRAYPNSDREAIVVRPASGARTRATLPVRTHGR
jgi:galactokinase